MIRKNQAELDRQLARLWLVLRAVELAADAAGEENLREDIASMGETILSIQSERLKSARLRTRTVPPRPAVRIQRN